MGSLGRSCCCVKACLEHPLCSPHRRSTLEPTSGKGARARPRGPSGGIAATPCRPGPEASPHAHTRSVDVGAEMDAAGASSTLVSGRRGGRAAARPNAHMVPPRLEEAWKAARSDARKAPWLLGLPTPGSLCCHAAGNDWPQDRLTRRLPLPSTAEGPFFCLRSPSQSRRLRARGGRPAIGSGQARCSAKWARRLQPRNAAGYWDGRRPIFIKSQMSNNKGLGNLGW